MPKARTAKLKVYCTPVGFHDAYVAAPSQKAALEAWGAKTNLFAQGAAQLVSDERLTKAPLQNPGEVIKVLRGSDAEQLAALERAPSPKHEQEKRSKLGKPLKAPPGPKPSRSKLTKAEEALETLQERQSKQRHAIEEEQRQLDAKRRELEQRQGREMESAKQAAATEKEAYDRAVRRWADRK